MEEEGQTYIHYVTLLHYTTRVTYYIYMYIMIYTHILRFYRAQVGSCHPFPTKRGTSVLDATVRVLILDTRGLIMTKAEKSIRLQVAVLGLNTL